MNEYLDSLFSLCGKVAVVIGGTGELCGAIASGLAQAGAEVVLVGRDPEKARVRLDGIRAEGGNVRFFPSDVSTRASLENLCGRVVEDLGKVDILINGAGVNSATPFFEISEDEFDRIMLVNFKSVFLSCQVFGSHMVSNGSGSIINIGSASGLTPLSRVFTYSASKGAVHNLSKNLAREWAASGVRVNILVPGFFPAEQNRKVLTPDRIESIMRHTPMRRFGDSKELIGAALLLASEAGSFITGHELVVDGGYASMTI
ncbi:MAG: putative oxidoreductase UxuB [Verrucomicrobia bacterium ADurb.Bin474]|nr:MAG: putative oxidoreductase UxuB [Verrucomicrobia bacterium ADurb.Bin474]